MSIFESIENWKDLVSVDINQAASEFGELPEETAIDFIDKLGVQYFVDLVSKLGSDVAVELLRNLPEEYKDKILSRLPSQQVLNITAIFSYPEGTAGSLMAKEYLSIPIDSTIKEAIHYLQSLTRHIKGKVSYIYVVDKNTRLEGVIQVRDLIFYEPSKLVKEILKSPVVQVEAGMSQIAVAKLLQRHHYLGLPVVDESQRLVGVVSADNVLKVLEDEAQDDIAKIVGIAPEEIKTSSIKRIVSLRLPWLFVNILSGLICAYISGLFQNSLQSVVTLFLFVPIVLGLSESIGVQGATIVVRNIALGDSTFKDLSEIFFREIFVGVLIGIVCGGFVGTVASLWHGSELLGVALASSMASAIIISALIGLLMPMFFAKIKIDPAMASGPLVLAICDIQTLIVYFNLSSFILKG